MLSQYEDQVADSSDFNYLVGMLEEQLKSMYRSWDSMDDTHPKIDIS